MGSTTAVGHRPYRSRPVMAGGFRDAEPDGTAMSWTKPTGAVSSSAPVRSELIEHPLDGRPNGSIVRTSSPLTAMSSSVRPPSRRRTPSSALPIVLECQRRIRVLRAAPARPHHHRRNGLAPDGLSAATGRPAWSRTILATSPASVPRRPGPDRRTRSRPAAGRVYHAGQLARSATEARCARPAGPGSPRVPRHLVAVSSGSDRPGLRHQRGDAVLLVPAVREVRAFRGYGPGLPAPPS